MLPPTPPRLLQTPEGYFDVSEGLALALNAHVEDDDESNDCPLTCQVEAIEKSVPEMVLAANGGAEGLGEAELARLKSRIWVRASERPQMLPLALAAAAAPAERVASSRAGGAAPRRARRRRRSRWR